MRVLAWLIMFTAQCLKVSGRCGESLTIMKKGRAVNKEISSGDSEYLLSIYLKCSSLCPNLKILPVIFGEGSVDPSLRSIVLKYMLLFHLAEIRCRGWRTLPRKMNVGHNTHVSFFMGCADAGIAFQP